MTEYMPVVTSVWPGWIATSPLNRRPSTNTGQSRSAPPREQKDAEPSYGIAVDGPEIDAVCVGRQITIEQPQHSKSYEHPAVATVLAHTGAHIPPAKSAAPDSAKSAIASETNGGMGKNAAGPPRAITASANRRRCRPG